MKKQGNVTTRVLIGGSALAILINSALASSFSGCLCIQMMANSAIDDSELKGLTTTIVDQAQPAFSDHELDRRGHMANLDATRRAEVAPPALV